MLLKTYCKLAIECEMLYDQKQLNLILRSSDHLTDKHIQGLLSDLLLGESENRFDRVG